MKIAERSWTILGQRRRDWVQAGTRREAVLDASGRINPHKTREGTVQQPHPAELQRQTTKQVYTRLQAMFPTTSYLVIPFEQTEQGTGILVRTHSPEFLEVQGRKKDTIIDPEPVYGKNGERLLVRVDQANWKQPDPIDATQKPNTTTMEEGKRSMSVVLTPADSQELITAPQGEAVLNNLGLALERGFANQFGPSTRLQADLTLNATTDGTTGPHMGRLSGLIISGQIALLYSGKLSDVALEVARQELMQSDR